MTTSLNEIKRWVLNGVERDSTHVIIAVDTWDHEDYPVYVNKNQSVYEIISSYHNKQDCIMEVYNLSMNIDEQLNQSRAWNI